MRRINLVGVRRNMFTVISFSHIHIQPSGQKRAVWIAKCDCGKEFKISASSVLHSNTKSCGCYIGYLRKLGMRKRDPDSEIKQFITHYKASAKIRNKLFSLSFQEFKDLVTSNCMFCGEEPQNRYTKIGKLRKVKYNGIDRLNNNVGYIKENCVPCCGLCNRMKGESSVDEFKQKIINIYKNYVSVN